MKKLIRLILVTAVIFCCGYAETHQRVHADAFQSGYQPGHSSVIQPKYELESILKKCPNCGRTNTYRVKEQMIMPSCTQRGLLLCRCEDHTGLGEECGYENEEWVPALGHNYGSMTVQKAATCTASGTGKYTCKRCGHVKTETIKALGHNYVYTDIEATCTEEGHHTGTCSRCGNVVDEVFPALGHEFGEYVVIIEAGCETDGILQADCIRGDVVDQQVIPAIGHAFPEEWTIVKKPGLLISGLRQKVCGNCGMVIEEVLPAKIPTPVAIIVTGGAAVLGAGLVILKKIRAARKLFKPSIETKTVVIRSDNEDLVKLLKDRLYLSVSACDEESLLETVEDKEPNLLICQFDDQKKVKDLLKEKRKQIKALEEAKKKKEENKEVTDEEKEEEKTVLAETPIGLILGAETIKSAERTLKKAVSDKLISGYVSDDNDNYNTFVKFVLPVLKPDLKSDESLSNFGEIADLLGIPGISTLVNVYTSGRDIKATLEEGELGVSGTATIISDIASILGLDTVGSIAGLVDDVEAISKAVEEESGAHEQKKGVSAIKDIAEVVSDIVE